MGPTELGYVCVFMKVYVCSSVHLHLRVIVEVTYDTACFIIFTGYSSRVSILIKKQRTCPFLSAMRLLVIHRQPHRLKGLKSSLLLHVDRQIF